MAFKFNVKPIAAEAMDSIDLLQAQEELNQAFMDLTDAQKGMAEVCEVMENIQTSMDLITKYGAAGVEQLNVDGSLEALLQVPAKLITAEKATEGLVSSAKELWDKFVEAVKRIFDRIRKVVRNLFPSKSKAVRDDLSKARWTQMQRDALDRYCRTGDTSGMMFNGGAYAGPKLGGFEATSVSTESVTDQQGETRTPYCTICNEIVVMQTQTKSFDEMHSAMVKIHSSLYAVSKTLQSGNIEKSDAAEQLKSVIFNNDSYFFKAKDALDKAKEAIAEARQHTSNKDTIGTSLNGSDLKKAMLEVLDNCDHAASKLDQIANQAEESMIAMGRITDMNLLPSDIRDLLRTGYSGITNSCIEIITVANSCITRINTIVAAFKKIA